jgi:hypothetical protein
MEIKITHHGQVLHEVEITPDAQVHVRSAQQGGWPPAPQYVWGATGGGHPAPQYVWGGQGGMAPHMPQQYVWGATNDRAGGLHGRAVSIDCPGRGAVSGDGLGAKVTDGLVK